MKKRLILFFSIIVFCSGCVSMLEEGGFLTPQPVKSEYFETQAAGFSIETNKPDIVLKYMISVKVLKSLPEGGLIEFLFENPDDKNSPIVVELPVDPTKDVIYTESPELNEVEYYQGYIIQVNIYNNAQERVVLGSHRQLIQAIANKATVRKMLNKKEKENKML